MRFDIRRLSLSGLSSVPLPTDKAISSPGVGSNTVPVTVQPGLPVVKGILSINGSPTLTQMMSPKFRISTVPSSFS